MQEVDTTEIAVPKRSPHLAMGFLNGVGITAVLAGIAEYFDHSLCPGTTSYLDKVQCLAQKPLVWGGLLAAGVAGMVIDGKNTKIKEATDKNGALIEILEERDRQNLALQQQALVPASNAPTPQVRIPLGNRSELVKRVDYIEEPPSPAMR